MNKKFSDDEIKLWVRYLEKELSIKEINQACKRILAESGRKFFPTIQEFIKLGRKEKPEMKLQILNAIRRFGFYQASKAKDYLGLDIWEEILNRGGWSRICSMDYDKLDFALKDIKPLAAPNLILISGGKENGQKNIGR